MMPIKKGLVTITSEPFTRVVCTDSAGETVYARNFVTPARTVSLNLPDGNYDFTFDGRKKDFISDNSKPTLYLTPPNLPASDNKKGAGEIKAFKKFSGFDGSCAFTDTHKGVMYFNDLFLTLPLYAREFIIEHEKAHLKYLSEEYADLSALAETIKKGKNISPCLLTLETVLKKSPSNDIRISAFLQTLKQYT